MSSFLGNSRHGHASCARYSRNVQDQKIAGSSQFAEYYETNRKNYQEKEHLYKRRQAIVEHPFGTMKRSRLPSGGVLLYTHEIRNRTGKCRCRIYAHRVQFPEDW
jgi:hypothetical protein